jgi:ribosomal protein L22
LKNKSKTVPEAYFPFEEEKIVNPTWQSKKENLHYSSNKFAAILRYVQGKHVFDAITYLRNLDKWGKNTCLKLLKACMHNGD